ncbi:MAG: hypothetical protein EBX40_07340 [Gammaproteobacteria bacterium]|nr:hypothetical protein [Gammaproteobacteria bacterium]
MGAYKMAEYKEIIFDVVSGKVTERPYSAAEIAEMKKAEAEIEKLNAKITAQLETRKSALSKLAALGLTEEEIAAL